MVASTYSDYLNQSFTVPIYDFFHQTKNLGGNLKLYLISSFLNKEEIYFGVLAVSKRVSKFNTNETLRVLSLLDVNRDINSTFPDWDNPNRFFIHTVLTNEKIITRGPYINYKSPIGKLKLPPLKNITHLSYQAVKQETILKITSHYNIIGERGFLLFYRNEIIVYNAKGDVELGDELNIGDEIKSKYLLFKAWGNRVMNDHMLNYPFLVAFKWIDRNFIIDLIGTVENKITQWQIPIFSLSDSNLNIFDIKKCLSYSVYLDKTPSYKKHINSIFSEVKERCPVKKLICTHKNLITNVYWIDDRDIYVRQLYQFTDIESYTEE